MCFLNGGTEFVDCVALLAEIFVGTSVSVFVYIHWNLLVLSACALCGIHTLGFGLLVLYLCSVHIRILTSAFKCVACVGMHTLESLPVLLCLYAVFV